MSTVHDILASNLARVEERIVAACERAGRPRHAVTLVAVTKSVSVEVASELVALGVRDLGENRPQELWRKAAALPSGVRWHMIGHLQRNKIDNTLPIAQRIHSVDSVRLLQAIDASKAIGRCEVLVEVNCSGESSKQGFAPANLAQIKQALTELHRVKVVGLMTMAALEEDPEKCRPTFAQLRQSRDALHRVLADRHPLTELSMGMSNDFEVAIEEGATMIRLGSVLFEGLPT